MCCCCSPRCLKLMIFIGCIILIAIGAVLIWGGYSFQNSPFISLINFPSAGYVMIAIGGALILFAAFGFFGAWKESKLLLALFIIIVSLIGLLLVAMGAAFLYARTLADTYLSDTADCVKQFESADEAAFKAASTLCTQYCPCEATDSYAIGLCKNLAYCSKGTIDVLHCDPCIAVKDSGVVVTQDVINWVQENLGITVSSSSCDISSTFFTDTYFKAAEEYIPLLKWVEESFECSGLCIAQPFYLFSDINNGQPKDACMSSLYDWIQEKFLIFGIISIILGLYLVKDI